ncbi:hypothetical protein GLOTRDRAFT_77477 [Gloeophyllum trabeum ATCC 11539]|uniref:Cwf19-like C-terminal domain-containing protein n=1 Tax=Gloeophyllum trabeum (strain ATCC 11539 / FP-39264 / Madison 617) TaxID=670483 RepID=S7RK35_GLOTA|nr:uncharacterized protein GLOTRDRAFT_77477 [Gloeophyllum trabeum ATCC 11539]EPQ54755.1 hypothetical protein GLOTRDRAFT_77477 [Gloeophyllum trabeum ATCC 11539]
MADVERLHSKDKRPHDKEHKSKKRHRDEVESERKKRKRKEKDAKVQIVDEDPDDDDMWIEKNIDMDGEQPLATDIPTAESLKLTSRAIEEPSDPPLPPPLRTETALKRDDWMLMPPTAPSVPTVTSTAHTPNGDESLTDDYGEPEQNQRRLDGGVDFFSSLGTERKKKPAPEKPDPEKPKISYRELNPDINPNADSSTFAATPKAITPGGPGSQWRMMKLRRVYETAEEEGRPVEQVALERFDSLEAFEQAKEERRVLDEREGRRQGRRDKGKERQGVGESAQRFMFTDIAGSGASSRSSSFRRPGGFDDSRPATPSPANAGSRSRTDRLRDQGGMGTPLAQSHTPIPSVVTPQVGVRTSKSRAMSPSSLNRLQAKVLRAKLMGAPDAAELEKQYEEEQRKAQEEGGAEVKVLPTLDARGRLYDVGTGSSADDRPLGPGNRKKREKVETRDPKTGELVRVNADDDKLTLGEMLRQERFGAGPADQKNLDMQFANAIATDGGFQDNIDYLDENVEKLARQKMRSDAMKRQFAIHDYKRTQQALATCPFCFGEDDSPPKAPVIAMGTRVYLSCTLNEELVPGHCLIVPIQHHLAMLEGDDDVWDEVRNFMKCLMKMFAEEDRGVIFYETVVSFKQQRHTYIECVPLTWDRYDEIPGYFRESILASEVEWSTHKKLIDFSARPGGFRRAMVPNLPYFMVQFDHKGEKGFGHVIEGTSEATDAGEDDGALDEGAKGGGEFPRYFAAEIIGNLLDLEPRRWMKPRRIDFSQNKRRVAEFRKNYDKYDWTGMIGKS